MTDNSSENPTARRDGRARRRDAMYTAPVAGLMAAVCVGFAWHFHDQLPLWIVLTIVGLACGAFGMVVGAWLKPFG